jgi:TPR repeat protein
VNSRVSTDVELASLISDSVGKHYRDGVRCIEVLPQASLVMFRQVLEALCERIQPRAGLPASQAEDLYRSIRRLTDEGLITFASASAMHRVRKIANTAAHVQPESSDAPVHAQAEPRPDVLLENAREARTDLVSVFKSLHFQGLISEIADELRYEKFDDLQWGQDLYLASTTFNAEDKYRAGVLCEAQSERVISSDDSIVVSDAVKYQYEFLRRQAALFFQVSDQLKRNDDARYRYGLAVWEGIVDADKKQEGFEILRAAADRGHGEACLYFGAALSEDPASTKQAVTYWQRAVDLGYLKGHFYLGACHLAGGALGPDYAQVVLHWDAGAEGDDPDCLYALGRLYFDDGHIPKDAAKAKDYFTRAASLGHRGARAYKRMFVDGGVEAVQGAMLDFANQWKAQIEALKPKPIKVQRHPVNELCSCGSGKKYKKCHGRRGT